MPDLDPQGVPCTIYHRPNARRESVVCRHIYADDAAAIRAHGITLSMEDAGPLGTAVYFDTGHVTDDGEPDEHLITSEGRTCQDTIRAGLAELRKSGRIPD